MSGTGNNFFEPGSTVFDINSQESLRSLECPVCLELPVPPIGLCRVGHSICGLCWKKTERCPTCRSSYTRARNYALEGLTAQIEVKCRHTSCSRIMKAEELVDHLSSCDFRPVICRWGSCRGTLVDFPDYTNHLVESHRRIVRSSTTWYDLYGTKWDASIFDEKFRGACVSQPLFHDDLHFLVNLEVDLNTMYIWISGMMGGELAEEYFVDLQLEDNAKCSGKTMEWCMGILLVHVEKEGIRHSMDCASIPLRTLRSYAKLTDDNTRYTFSMKLKLTKKSDTNRRLTRSRPKLVPETPENAEGGLADSMSVLGFQE